MISLAQIRKLIDQTQKDYEECWNDLSAWKADPLSMTTEALLEFQPKLASALLRLSDMHHALSKESKSLISKKQMLSPKWFGHRMKTLAAYRGVIAETTKTGKVLGDAFAWLFYQRERKYLRKHFEHAPTQMPSGLGGKGELAFIKSVRLWEGQITIFHGITNFLRIGDVSFYDPKSGRITAIGELKTEKEVRKRFLLQVHVRWPKESDEVWPLPSKKSKRTKLTMSRKQQQQLRRQLQTMDASFALRKPRETIKLEDKTHLDEFRQLAKTLQSKSVAFQKAGDGLLLFGFTMNGERSYFGRLWPAKTKEDFDRRFAGLVEQVHSIMDITQVGSPSNANSIFHSTLDLATFPGTTPIFWWSLPLDFIRKLIFHEVTVVTIYNPGHFVRKLRTWGYQVELHRTELKVTKRIGDSQLEMGNMHYFVNLIQQHLVREELVLATFENILKRIDSGEILPNSRIDLDFQVYY
ncbi:MAG: hypothetical protein ACXWID_09365 [Pyrinomonadaceae bacterium]